MHVSVQMLLKYYDQLFYNRSGFISINVENWMSEMKVIHSNEQIIFFGFSLWKSSVKFNEKYFLIREKQQRRKKGDQLMSS